MQLNPSLNKQQNHRNKRKMMLWAQNQQAQ